MSKTTIALKLLKNPIVRKAAVNALSNPKVRGIVIDQAKKQVGRRLLGK